MQVRYRRIDKELPQPAYQTPGAVAFDLVARENAYIPAGETRLVPVNLVVEVPPGYCLIVVSRSSLPQRKGLAVANGVGLIDQDYHGPDDEIAVLLRNTVPTRGAIRIERGERIAQALIVPALRADLVEVDELAAVSRGGFGSTDGYAP